MVSGFDTTVLYSDTNRAYFTWSCQSLPVSVKQAQPITDRVAIPEPMVASNTHPAQAESWRLASHLWHRSLFANRNISFQEIPRSRSNPLRCQRDHFETWLACDAGFHDETGSPHKLECKGAIVAAAYTE